MNIDTTNAPNTTETAIGFIPCYQLPFVSLFHADCMEIMKQYPDKYFDLAIVDPPYGINADTNQLGLANKKGFTKNAGTYKQYHQKNTLMNYSVFQKIKLYGVETILLSI